MASVLSSSLFLCNLPSPLLTPSKPLLISCNKDCLRRSVRQPHVCSHGMLSSFRQAPDMRIVPGKRSWLASATAASSGLAQIFPVSGPWGVWCALIMAGAFGVWALVATLAGMLLANVGVLPQGAAELKIVYKYLLPLAIPMLLLSANLRRIITETGRLLPAFLLGSLTTVIGSILAMTLFPLGNFLGGDGWKVAAALTARHIGGAVNYMAVSDSLAISPSVFGAGLAADDLILTFYFTAIYTLAKAIPPEVPAVPLPGKAAAAGPATEPAAVATAATEPQPQEGGHSAPNPSIQVLEGIMALALSALICHLGTATSSAFGIPGQSITVITACTVTTATLFPSQLAPLATSAQGLAQILMQIFYATIGASANVGLVLRTAPVLFLFSSIALAGHLLLLLLLGRLAGFSKKDLLLASNANIGGPSTVAGMAAAKGWTSSLAPSILTSTLGYAIGTFIGMGIGHSVLAKI